MRPALAAALAGVLLLGAAAPAAPPDHPVVFIGVDEVKRLRDRGVAVDLIDVRTTPEFEELHIQGARSIPLRSMAGRLADVPKDGLVVFY